MGWNGGWIIGPSWRWLRWPTRYRSTREMVEDAIAAVWTRSSPAAAGRPGDRKSSRNWSRPCAAGRPVCARGGEGCGPHHFQAPEPEPADKGTGGDGGRRRLRVAAALSDVDQQLAGLVGPRFLSSAGFRRLPDIERYLAALERRLKRPPTPAGIWP